MSGRHNFLNNSTKRTNVFAVVVGVSIFFPLLLYLISSAVWKIARYLLKYFLNRLLNTNNQPCIVRFSSPITDFL